MCICDYYSFVKFSVILKFSTNLKTNIGLKLKPILVIKVVRYLMDITIKYDEDAYYIWFLKTQSANRVNICFIVIIYYYYYCYITSFKISKKSYC